MCDISPENFEILEALRSDFRLRLVRNYNINPML